ncbi:MAG: DUF3883 domain-containing protein [Merismopedia sp. SIO2A8]|nr:DUF3883 domain-containing protein [Merismopedia sp. SIO2A8]
MGIDLERLQLAPVTRVAKTQVYESVVYRDDGTTDPEKAKEIGDWGEAKAKEFLKKQGYEVVDTDDYCSYDLEYKERNGQKIKVEVKTISNDRPNIRLTVREWEEMISSGENYELIICVHKEEKLQKIIHIQVLWSTLQDRIKQLHTQAKTNYQYRSGKIESCLGLQLNEKEANNHILLNWHRLFQNVEHPHITEH